MSVAGRPIRSEPARSRPIGLPRYQEKLTLGLPDPPSSHSQPTEFRVTLVNGGSPKAVVTSSSVTDPHWPKKGPGAVTGVAATVDEAWSPEPPDPQPARVAPAQRSATATSIVGATGILGMARPYRLWPPGDGCQRGVELR